MADTSNVTVVNTGTVGSINQFSVNQDWEIFIERLEQYFLANKVEEDRRVPVLLTTITETVYKVLKNLCDPVTPSRKSYEELKKTVGGAVQTCCISLPETDCIRRSKTDPGIR